MKIILSSNSSWNLYNFRIDLIEKFLSKKNEVYILSPYDEYTSYLTKKGCKFREIKINQRGTSFISDYFLLIRYYILLKKIKPDYYLGFTIKPNIYGSIVSNFLKIKTINTITGLGSTFITKKILKYLVIFLYNLSLKKSFKVFFHNKDDLDLFVLKNIINKKNSSVIMGSGINLKKFKYTPMSFNTKKINFLFVGRVIKEKGFFDLIKAIKIIKKKYHNTNFVIVGKLPKNYLNDVTINNINHWRHQNLINFIGFKKDIRKYIKSSHCLILPSFREGLSRSIIEAISIGRPIITYNVSGCKDLVQNNKNGYLSKKNDFLKLSQNIEKFINLSNIEKSKMGKFGYQKYAQRLDVNKVNDKYIKLIYR